MGRIKVRDFKHEPLETLELENGKNLYLYRPTEETRYKVQAAIAEHDARVKAYVDARQAEVDALAERMEEVRAQAETEGGDDDPDKAARQWLEDEPVQDEAPPVDVTPRYQAAAIVACHLKPVGLDPGVVLEELGESLVHVLWERVTQETTGEAAKKLLAGPGLRGI